MSVGLSVRVLGPLLSECGAVSAGVGAVAQWVWGCQCGCWGRCSVSVGLSVRVLAPLLTEYEAVSAGVGAVAQ